MMGYYGIIGQCATSASNDTVNRSTGVYTDTRTGRKAKLFTSTTMKNNLNIQGGRYLDLFGTGESTTGTETTGYCNSERYTNPYLLSISRSSYPTIRIFVLLELN